MSVPASSTPPTLASGTGLPMSARPDVPGTAAALHRRVHPWLLAPFSVALVT
jgi:hypothetical protein